MLSRDGSKVALKRRRFELRILEINAISSGKKVQIKISVLFNVL